MSRQSNDRNARYKERRRCLDAGIPVPQWAQKRETKKATPSDQKRVTRRPRTGGASAPPRGVAEPVTTDVTEHVASDAAESVSDPVTQNVPVTLATATRPQLYARAIKRTVIDGLLLCGSVAGMRASYALTSMTLEGLAAGSGVPGAIALIVGESIGGRLAHRAWSRTQGSIWAKASAAALPAALVCRATGLAVRTPETRASIDTGLLLRLTGAAVGYELLAAWLGPAIKPVQMRQEFAGAVRIVSPGTRIRSIQCITERNLKVPMLPVTRLKVALDHCNALTK